MFKRCLNLLYPPTEEPVIRHAPYPRYMLPRGIRLHRLPTTSPVLVEVPIDTPPVFVPSEWVLGFPVFRSEDDITSGTPDGDVPPSVGDSGPVNGILRPASAAVVEEKSVSFGEDEIREIPVVDEVVPAAAVVVAPVGPTFLQGIIARVFAGTKDKVAVGLVQEVYAGLPDEEGDSDIKFSVGFWASCKAAFFGSHDSRHRTIRRVASLIKELRPLLDELRFENTMRELADVSEIGKAYTENAVKRILRKAVEEGRVEARRCATLKRLLVVLAPMSTDEDDFAALVSRVVRSKGGGY